MAAPVMEKLAYRNLMTLADLTPSQILYITRVARQLKARSEQILTPRHFAEREKNWEIKSEIRRAHPQQTLRNMSIGLLFSKRSTRTRLAAETAAKLLGGQAIFLGKDDIQLGVNESARDTAMVLSRMVQGIFARVGDHSEIEEIAKYSKVPVINALSSLWHPTQVLADLATLENIREFWVDPKALKIDDRAKKALRPLTIAYIGDSANVLHDMLVTYPRLGHTLQVASPDNAKYRAPTPVWDRVVELGCDKSIKWTADPREAVCGADVVVTDTWISMGQEAEYEERVNAFKGYQVTEKLCAEGKANPNWKFLHCLPRKQHEVDDEVFYGPRSFVWPEAENRKWTIMAIFHLMIGGARTNPFETPSDALATMEKF